MKRVISYVAGLAIVLFVSTPAFAQQDRKAAIVAMAPGAVGVLLPATDSVAIRPEFSFAKSTNDITSGSTTTKFDSWQVGAGVSALFYNGKPDAFRTYWSPRVTMTHATFNSNGSNDYSVTGSFGAQYSTGSRFTVFGELGLNYAWQKDDSTSPTGVITSTSKSHALGTRSTVGVAFKF